MVDYTSMAKCNKTFTGSVVKGLRQSYGYTMFLRSYRSMAVLSATVFWRRRRHDIQRFVTTWYLSFSPSYGSS